MKSLQLFSVTEAKTILLNFKMVFHPSWKAESTGVEATEDISKDKIWTSKGAWHQTRDKERNDEFVFSFFESFNSHIPIT